MLRWMIGLGLMVPRRRMRRTKRTKRTSLYWWSGNYERFLIMSQSSQDGNPSEVCWLYYLCKGGKSK